MVGSDGYDATAQRAGGPGTDFCRMVLQYFDGHPNPVATVDGLAAAIGARDVGVEDESQIAIRLHHVTLPKLSDSGLVDYDPRSEAVRCRAQPGGSERGMDGKSRGRTWERGKSSWR